MIGDGDDGKKAVVVEEKRQERVYNGDDGGQMRRSRCGRADVWAMTTGAARRERDREILGCRPSRTRKRGGGGGFW